MFGFVQICYYLYNIIYTFGFVEICDQITWVSKIQLGFIFLNQTMTFFTLKEHILFISKSISMIFVALDVLGV